MRSQCAQESDIISALHAMSNVHTLLLLQQHHRPVPPLLHLHSSLTLNTHILTSLLSSAQQL
jgi:hypothetical protein